MSNVQNEEVQAQTGKGIRESNQVPRKVTFKYSSLPSEHVEIVSNEVASPTGKSTNQYCIRNMVMGFSIPNEGILDLDGTPSRQKMRIFIVSDSNVIPKCGIESSGGSREIITPGADIEDGIVNSTQNSIRDRLWRDKLVNNGNTFEFIVNQIYRPIEGKDKFRIRKPHHLHIHNLKALMRHNPYAHVVDYLVVVDPKYVPTKDEFDRTRIFHYK